MPAPDRVAAATLLLDLDPPPWLLRHSRAVAEVASWLARRARQAGLSPDRPAVEAAALLHDADKALPTSDRIRRFRHGEASAAWLTSQGLSELAPLVAWHPVTRLADGEAAERWLAEASLEARLVAYADKRAGQRLGSMAERFADWATRYPVGARKGWDEATAAAVLDRAERLEHDVCERLRVRPEAVGRVRWTGAAIAAAVARGAAAGRRGTTGGRAASAPIARGR
ncbi:MAG TPA: HD domain-containing protein [Candidatus Dormibacteraeota bacterium]|nr:HD domain-containing protein [Candidatus Dormibacteraeota bacterium]